MIGDTLDLDAIKAREYAPIPDESIDAIMAAKNRPDWVTREMLVEYHEHYVAGDCPGCQARGWFRWGLVHGEGFCDRCGWPGTAYHFLAEPGTKQEDEDYYRRRFRWEGILWAHPREVARA